MPILEVLTRTYKRPTWLEINQASLRAQTDSDWLQTLLPDEVGRGNRWADARLATVQPIGDYIWPLDDDDFCPEPTFVATLREIVQRHEWPPAVFFRIDVAQLGMLPPEHLWGQAPQLGACGTGSMVVRADVWRHHRWRWACEPPKIGDYEFIASVWDRHSEQIIWHDMVARRALRISHGEPEPA